MSYEGVAAVDVGAYHVTLNHVGFWYPKTTAYVAYMAAKRANHHTNTHLAMFICHTNKSYHIKCVHAYFHLQR